MKIEYKSKKVEKVCNNLKEATKKYGKKVAKKLQLRLMQIQALDNLEQVPTSPPFRRHKLNGNKAGYFAINITESYRLLIKASDGDDEDISTITVVCVEEVSNHYDD